MENTIKLGIVEDQELFRDGIKNILESRGEIRFVFESPDGFSMLDRLEKSPEIPDIMLVDLSLPNHNGEQFSGIQVVEVLRNYYPEIKILILSVHEEPHMIAKCIEMGVNGYLVKDSSAREVYEAIFTVYHRGSYLNERALSAIQNKLNRKQTTPKEHEVLTQRELEVLRLICQQKTAEEIGELLFISPKTVNGHRNNLLHKTGARNITGLVMYAIKHGIVEPI